MDTIAAISTAPGIGGIGIVRMSGEKCFEILEKIFKPKQKIEIDQIKGYTIKYGHIMEKEVIIDEVLVSFFKAPNSYTAENVCEINSHGGTYLVKKILELCLENGAELAEPGEFTKRAFLNGRMDLSQAEAVIDVIEAKTDKEAKSSIQQLEGYLSREIQKIREMLMSIMVEVEVSIDYPEYDVEEVSNHKAEEVLVRIKERLQILKNSFASGKIIKEGIKVALIGRPNVGKSSLLNTILKEERAIVSQIEGTTRDTIEEAVVIKGIPVHIIDTAGIRNASNEVEKIGIEKSKKIAEQADLLIAIFDISNPLTKEDKEILEILKQKKHIIVLNKVDLKQRKLEMEMINQDENVIEVSIKENRGIEEIYEKISNLFELEEINLDNSNVVTNIRHKESINKAMRELEGAIDSVKQNQPIDIIAISVKNVMEELGKITGESVTEDIIKEIFSKFCLGK